MVVLLIAAIALNAGALSVENGIAPDDAVGPFVIGVFLALAAFFVDLRSAL